MFAAMTRADITPPKGLELAGYPHYPRNNEGFHDPLYAACMYLRSGDQEAVMITLDLLFFSKKHVQAVQDRVKKSCGIPADRVMISCSHTHSGPWAAGRLDIESLEAGKQQPAEYVAFLIDTLSRIIQEAKEAAFPAEFTWTTALCGSEVGVGGNRRTPGGPHDPYVSVMAIRDLEGRVRGAITNYSLHPTFIHEWSNVCTADYPCHLKLEMEEQLPGCLVGFAQGTSGNQSSRYYRQGESFDEAERVGRLMGKAALKALASATWRKEIAIASATRQTPMEIRSFGTEEELMARAEKEEAIYKDLYARYGDSKNRDEYYLWQNANLKLLGTEDQLGYVRMQKKGIPLELVEDENPVGVQVLRLGDVCVIGLQGEYFVEYGIYLKAMAGFGTVIVNSLTGGCLPGYCYTPQAYVTGGYEVDTSMLPPDFGLKLCNLALDAAKELQ